MAGAAVVPWIVGLSRLDVWEESHPAEHPAGHVYQLGHLQPSLGLKMQPAHFSPARENVFIRAGPFIRGDLSCLVYFVTWEQ